MSKLNRAWRSIKESWGTMKLWQKIGTVVIFPLLYPLILFSVIMTERMEGNMNLKIDKHYHLKKVK